MIVTHGARVARRAPGAQRGPRRRLRPRRRGDGDAARRRRGRARAGASRRRWPAAATARHRRRGPRRRPRDSSSGALASADVAGRRPRASPQRRADLFLVAPTAASCRRAHAAAFRASSARSAIRRRRRASAWTDAAADCAWAQPDPAAVLRAMDRFHPMPDVPARAASWAEWLYFNGRVGRRRVLPDLSGRADARRRQRVGRRAAAARSRRCA